MKMAGEAAEQILFVIDTDTYAGNFERQVCAYLTGQIGECGVGEEYAELAIIALQGNSLDITSL